MPEYSSLAPDFYADPFAVTAYCQPFHYHLCYLKVTKWRHDVRDSRDTAERIISTAEHIVCEQGLAALGVNQISAEACVGKPLIYRYFGGIDGVRDALRKKSMLSEIMKLPNGNITIDSILKIARKLAQNPLALEIMAADLSGMHHGDAQTAKRASVKEAQMAMMMAAISFVLMRSKSTGEWMGLSLSTANDLAVFEKAAFELFSPGDA